MERGVPRVTTDIYQAPVHINVGGTAYTTTLETLTSYPDSKIAKLFNGTIPIVLDPLTNHYFIDVNGSVFPQILDFLRYKELVLPNKFDQLQLLKKQAEYFEIKEMVEELRRLTNSEENDQQNEKYYDIHKQPKTRRNKRRSKQRRNKFEESEGSQKSEQKETENDSNKQCFIDQSKECGRTRRQIDVLRNTPVNRKNNVVVIRCCLNDIGQKTVKIHSCEELTLNEYFPGQLNVKIQTRSARLYEYNIYQINPTSRNTCVYVVSLENQIDCALFCVRQLLDKGYHLSSVTNRPYSTSDIELESEFVLTRMFNYCSE